MLDGTPKKIIPFVDLKKQYQLIKVEIDKAIQLIIENTSFIGGKVVKEFEEAFAKECDVKHVVSTSSGTTALYLALMALGVGTKDEVITVPATFIATTEAISQTGAKVVFVDIDPKTYTLDVNKLEKAITEKTKVIIPVHLYGHPADMTRINEIARKHNLTVIEDAAQAHLAEVDGKKIGSLSDATCFSFFPGKNLGAYGDAGCVSTQDSNLAKRMKMLANHGRLDKYEHEIVGYNYRMDAMQAAILNVKLKYLSQWTEQRRAIALKYNKLFADIEGIVTPFESEQVKHVYHLYVVCLERRDEKKDFLNQQNIKTGIHYPIPIHLQKAYHFLGHSKGDFPETEHLFSQCLSLPMFPEITEEEIKRVFSAFKKHCLV